MPRRAVWCATLLVAVAPACCFLAGLLTPRHSAPVAAARTAVPSQIALAPGELPAVSSEKQPAAAEKELHPVIVRHPATLGLLDSELNDVRGTPIGVACATCHEAGGRPALDQRDGAPEDFHAGVELAHGALSCSSCHDPADRTRLRLADGTPLPMAEVMQLCGQCHGPQFRDYERGSHGGMAGYWDRERGPQLRNSCVACHAAHQPAYPEVIPAAPPRDRFLPQHPAARPASHLPGREAHGATAHE
jgi:hypothetical protein